jgi:hypothetical protein
VWTYTCICKFQSTLIPKSFFWFHHKNVSPDRSWVQVLPGVSGSHFTNGWVRTPWPQLSLLQQEVTLYCRGWAQLRQAHPRVGAGEPVHSKEAGVQARRRRLSGRQGPLVLVLPLWWSCAVGSGSTAPHWSVLYSCVADISQSADALHVFLLICGLRQVKDPLYLVDAFSGKLLMVAWPLCVQVLAPGRVSAFRDFEVFLLILCTGDWDSRLLLWKDNLWD